MWAGEWWTGLPGRIESSIKINIFIYFLLQTYIVEPVNIYGYTSVNAGCFDEIIFKKLPVLKLLGLPLRDCHMN